MRVTGWRCLVCGATLDIATAMPWRCPNATQSDRHHVLAICSDDAEGDVAGFEAQGGDLGDMLPVHVRAPGANPLISYDADLAWASFADVHGVDAAARRVMVEQLDAAVRTVAGVGFVPTPFARSDALSDALGFTDGGGVWVKDETGGVGGSQKARHLVTILLHLLTLERLGRLSNRPPLAIASCGNAALAASTLAAAANWPIDVYVPTWMGDGFGDELERLGARIHRCERRAGDPPGDPAMFRFREAVAAGAIPFTVQGPENALALDGGRTIGWEIGDQLEALGVHQLDRMFVQVGGGAFASCLGAGLRDIGHGVRLVAVQAAGCAPLARAWQRAGGDVERGSELVAERWSELMTPWDNPHVVGRRNPRRRNVRLARGVRRHRRLGRCSGRRHRGRHRGSSPTRPIGRVRRQCHRQRRTRRSSRHRRGDSTNRVCRRGDERAGALIGGRYPGSHAREFHSGPGPLAGSRCCRRRHRRCGWRAGREYRGATGDRPDRPRGRLLSTRSEPHRRSRTTPSSPSPTVATSSPTKQSTRPRRSNLTARRHRRTLCHGSGFATASSRPVVPSPSSPVWRPASAPTAASLPTSSCAPTAPLLRSPSSTAVPPTATCRCPSARCSTRSQAPRSGHRRCRSTDRRSPGRPETRSAAINAPLRRSVQPHRQFRLDDHLDARRRHRSNCRCVGRRHPDRLHRRSRNRAVRPDAGECLLVGCNHPGVRTPAVVADLDGRSGSCRIDGSVDLGRRIVRGLRVRQQRSRRCRRLDAGRAVRRRRRPSCSDRSGARRRCCATGGVIRRIPRRLPARWGPARAVVGRGRCRRLRP